MICEEFHLVKMDSFLLFGFSVYACMDVFLKKRLLFWGLGGWGLMVYALGNVEIYVRLKVYNYSEHTFIHLMSSLSFTKV